jgi:hypothetical protein
MERMNSNPDRESVIGYGVATPESAPTHSEPSFLCSGGCGHPSIVSRSGFQWEQGRYDEEYLLIQRIEVIGLSSADAAVFDLPYFHCDVALMYVSSMRRLLPTGRLQQRNAFGE